MILRKLLVANIFVPIIVVLIIFIVFASRAEAANNKFSLENNSTTTSTSISTTNPLVNQGRTLFQGYCQRCHQPSGVGVEGIYPPLKNNEHVQDDEYVRSVLKNGRTGEIKVNGIQYNNVMPQFSFLDEDQVDTIIAYLQAGLPNNESTNNSSSAPEIVFAAIAFIVLILILLILKKGKRSSSTKEIEIHKT